MKESTYVVKARDTRGNTTILDECYSYDDALEIQAYESLRNPEHYIWIDKEEL